MSNILETILSKTHARQTGDGQWKGHCPHHDDKRPSLSISVNGQGIGLHCHAGCVTEAVVEALGLKMTDLFTESNGNGRDRIVATYDYTDMSGALLYQTVRFEPKAFRQRRPDGNGGWFWNLQDVQQVLYRLPDVLATEPGDLVFVCEGEKSADAIRGLGLVATTNALGAGKWPVGGNNYTEPLEGRRVVILPDNDPQGQNHAQDVAQSLDGVAAEVRILRLSELTDKGDPSDWVRNGGDRDALLTLVEETEPVGDLELYWSSKELPETNDYIAVLTSLGYQFRMNACNDTVEVNGEPMSDALRAKVRSQMRDLNYRRVNVMEDAWTAHAYDNRFHPVQDYLEGLRWDGRDHIAALADRFVDHHNFFHLFFRRWVVGAVARACEPKSCQNRMLVLDGPQGVGKSYWVRWLASPINRPELFVEGPINPDDKDCLLRLITAWLWEVSELGSTTRRSDREALKYFLSMQQVTVRKPYGRNDLIKPALASFVGTVNNVAGFLDDPTGYRRFMSVQVEQIDWGYAAQIDPEQVWAQAKSLYDQGEPWGLTSQEAECARFANEEYEIEDPLPDIFLRYYEITNEVLRPLVW